ncbi:uncharacterized protein ACOB8E_018305 [Sarcophilus harrisii]
MGAGRGRAGLGAGRGRGGGGALLGSGGGQSVRRGSGGPSRRVLGGAGLFLSGLQVVSGGFEDVQLQLLPPPKLSLEPGFPAKLGSSVTYLCVGAFGSQSYRLVREERGRLWTVIKMAGLWGGRGAMFNLTDLAAEQAGRYLCVYEFGRLYSKNSDKTSWRAPSCGSPRRLRGPTPDPVLPLQLHPAPGQVLPVPRGHRGQQALHRAPEDLGTRGPVLLPGDTPAPAGRVPVPGLPLLQPLPPDWPQQQGAPPRPPPPGRRLIHTALTMAALARLLA